MKIYGINLPNSSKVTNIAVPSGSIFPTENSGTGSLFYRLANDVNDGLYVYTNNQWKSVATANITLNSNISLNVNSPQTGQVLGYNGTHWVNTQAPGWTRKLVQNTYSALASDSYLGVQQGAALTIHLPSGVENKVLVIKDELGKANTRPITILPAGVQTIDGSPTYVMNTKYESVTLFFGGGSWQKI